MRIISLHDLKNVRPASVLIRLFYIKTFTLLGFHLCTPFLDQVSDILLQRLG